MTTLDTLAVGIHVISILMEVAVAVLGILLALSRKKLYGWGIALTFAIYTYYDIARLASLDTKAVPRGLYLVFFIASLSILWVVRRLYSEK